MGAFQITLVAATLLCSLVAGLVFGFAVVVMPGIKHLEDGEFIRAFQVMDRIIQDNQPLFMLAWIGSAIALIVATAFGFGQLDVTGRSLIGIALAAYLLGVHMPTITINIPLNNRLQALDVATLDAAARKAARAEFEHRWNRWNTARTYVSCLVSILLMVLLLRL